jgi:hypothetical protein
MAYNNLTSRTDAAALIPEQVSTEMLNRATDGSATLQLFRRVPVGARAGPVPGAVGAAGRVLRQR